MTERASPRKYETPERAAHYRGKYKQSWLRRLSNRRELGMVVKALARLGPVETVLDCPCGAGRLLPLLPGRVFAADAATTMVREAREEASAHFLVAAAQSLPFEDNSFDAIVCHRLLHHFPEAGKRRTILKELARVARRGVVVSFTDAGTWKARRKPSRRQPIDPTDLEADAATAGLNLCHPILRIGGFFSAQAVALLAAKKQPVLDRFVRELREDPEVTAVFVFGSFARGDDRPDSDIDLLVVANGAFRKEIVHREGVEFEIFRNNRDDTITFWKENPDDFESSWPDAKPLFDRDGTVAYLERAAAALRRT